MDVTEVIKIAGKDRSMEKGVQNVATTGEIRDL